MSLKSCKTSPDHSYPKSGGWTNPKSRIIIRSEKPGKSHGLIGTAELAKSLPENRHFIKKQTITIVQYIYIYISLFGHFVCQHLPRSMVASGYPNGAAPSVSRVSRHSVDSRLGAFPRSIAFQSDRGHVAAEISWSGYPTLLKGKMRMQSIGIYWDFNRPPATANSVE